MNAFSTRPTEHDFSSDTFDVVDACIEQVRVVAGLDEDVVLPPLPVVAPRREVVILTKNEVAGGAACGGADSTASHATAGDAGRARRELAPTCRVSRRSATSSGSRWALALCALVALGSAGASFLSSPLGRKPSVVRVTSSARAHAGHAVRAVVQTASRVRSP